MVKIRSALLVGVPVFLLSLMFVQGVSLAQRLPQDTTADHKKFKVLQKDFKNGPEVTEACLSCHTEAAKEVHKSIHWTWEFDTGKQKLGKRYVLNNF